MAVNPDISASEIMPAALSPFSQKYRSQWRRAIAVSVAVNAVLVGGLVWSLLDKPADVVTKPVEITVVSDSGTAGPKISTPQSKTVAPPPPLSAQAVEAIKNGVPVTEALQKDQPQNAVTAPTANANATSNASVASSSASTASASSDAVSGGSAEAAPTPSPAPPAQAQEAPKEDSITEPEYLGSRQLDGYSGSAVIGVSISADGTATSAWVISSSGDRGLVRAALQRARNGSYRPKTVNGEPVASTGVIHFSS